MNTTSIAIAPTTGVITVSTTARAGGGTIVLSPYSGVNTPLPNATAATFSPPSVCSQLAVHGRGSDEHCGGASYW